MLLKELRQVIREELAAHMVNRIQEVIKDALDAAEAYVEAVEHKKMFGKKALVNDMKEKVKQVVSLAKWLAMKYETSAIKVSDVAESLERIVEMSAYADQTWNNKENVEDLRAHLMFAQKTAISTMYNNMSTVLNMSNLNKIGSKRVA